MMSFNSSEDDSSCSDSEVEEVARIASNQIRKLIDQARTSKKCSAETQSKQLRKKRTETVLSSEKETLSENRLGFVIDKSPVTIEPSMIEINVATSGHHGYCNSDSDKDETSNAKTKLSKKNKKKKSLQTGIQISDNYLNLNNLIKSGKSKFTESKSYDEIMKKSVITPDFEKQHTVTPYEESVRQQKKQRKIEREKTKGKKWYDMPAQEMTEDKKNNLEILQMRKALDPKRFYKSNDAPALPKYFQFGTVVESPADFYHSRIPKKQQKSNMVEELLADAEFRKYNKRKYAEIQEQKRKAVGPYKHMKRLKKNKR